MASRLSEFLSELKRRRVYHVAAAYVAFAAVMVFGIPDLFETFRLPAEFAQIAIILIGIGFPLALVLAWVLEVKREEPASNMPTPPDPIASEGKRKSIVVLPFDNMSPDPRDTYFCDGLTEEIITHLSYIQSLRVISRNSAMVLKGTQKSTREIADELDVQFVLEGSVRKSGEKLRITAQLIDAITDEHLWAGKYDGVLEGVFDLQEDVSRSIVDSLELSTSPDEKRRLTERSVESVQVYECFLKAREELSKWSEPGLKRALEIIESGLRVLGENELLYVGLGTVYAQYIHFGAEKDRTYLQKAEECLEKVFSFNPDSSRGHYLKGFTQWWRGRPPEAVLHLKRALEIDPNDPDALVWLGWIYGISGKGHAAYPLFQRAIDVDPLNASIYGYTSGCQMLEGEIESALVTWAKGFQMDPRNPWFRVYQAFLFAYNQEPEKAHAVLDLLTTDTPDSHWAWLGTFLRHALRGDRDGAKDSVTAELRRAMEWNEFHPLLMAQCFVLIGENEEAVNWVEEAVKWGCIHYPFLNQYAPFFEGLRGLNRFEILKEKVKKEWEAFKV